MDNPQIWLESVKGIWSILAIIFTGVITWVGWSIRERIDRKKSEELYREKQEEKHQQMLNKFEDIEKLQKSFAKDIHKKLNKISAGLELCMEDDDIIFGAFRKTHVLNGGSEAQSKKLEAYRKSLMRDPLTLDDDE